MIYLSQNKEPAPMQQETKSKERWIELCEQAAVEQDRDRLMALISEIDRLLAEKEKRPCAVSICCG
jgi:hypothetical protein